MLFHTLRREKIKVTHIIQFQKLKRNLFKTLSNGLAGFDTPNWLFSQLNRSVTFFIHLTFGLWFFFPPHWKTLELTCQSSSLWTCHFPARTTLKTSINCWPFKFITLCNSNHRKILRKMWLFHLCVVVATQLFLQKLATLSSSSHLWEMLWKSHFQPKFSAFYFLLYLKWGNDL